jgi:putative addiction module killer protein
MKVAKEIKVECLVLSNGLCPFEDWLASLADTSLVRSIDARLTRIRDGNFGDHKSVGSGVFELRIDKGPGIRIYYGIVAQKSILLLAGGDKKSQTKDIKKAQKLWREFRK